MRLPRDVSGEELSRLLKRYGYTIIRQEGSHLRLVSSIKGSIHRTTIPKLKPLKVGTLNGILKDIADYLEIDKKKLTSELFEK